MNESKTEKQRLFSEKMRRDMVFVMLVITGMFSIVMIAMKNIEGSLNINSLFAGLAAGIFVYAIFFVRGPLKIYFPEFVFAFIAGGSALIMISLGSPVAMTPGDLNMDLASMSFGASLCLCYFILGWLHGFPELPVKEKTISN